MKRIKIFVISDIHASSIEKSNPESWAAPEHDSDTLCKPLESLIELIKENNIRADYVAFCGDLTHRHDFDGLMRAWNFLQEIKKLLGASKLIPTLGNHDIDSRLLGSTPDPCHSIRALNPKFPSVDETEYNSFWANDYYITSDQYVRFVCINSCRFHGVRPPHSDEVEDSLRTDEMTIGRFPDRSLTGLKEELTNQSDYPINVLISHHSPQIHCEHNLGEDDYLRNGQLIVDTLGNGEFGDWIILHGHKHHPKLTYSSGGSCSPVVFSSASASVKLYEELSMHSRNQVHMIELPIIENGFNSKLCGTIETWSWTYGNGWSKLSFAGGLPSQTGFGHRNIHSIASQINELIPKGTVLSWEQILQQLEELSYLTPVDIITLKNALKANYDVIIDLEGAIPMEIYAK